VERAYQIEPDHYMVLFNLGVLSMRENQNKSAITYFDQVIQLEPSYGYAYLNKGIIYQRMGLNDQAIQVFSNGLNECDDAVYLTYNRACSYLKIGQKESCIADLVEILESYPEMSGYMSEDLELAEVIKTSTNLRELLKH
jgi:tetratricopeptide (TPR) repeat protein